MKQVSIDQMQQRLYVGSKAPGSKDWPYKAQTAPANLNAWDDIQWSIIDPDACTECNGTGMAWRPKNPRTGSLTLARCEACDG